MKIVIIREEIIQPDITAEELISKWKELEAIPGAGRVQLQIVDTYPSMEELDEAGGGCGCTVRCLDYGRADE